VERHNNFLLGRRIQPDLMYRGRHYCQCLLTHATRAEPKVQGRSHCAFPLVTTKNHRDEPLTLPYIDLKATLANFTTAFVKFTTVQTPIVM